MLPSGSKMFFEFLKRSNWKFIFELFIVFFLCDPFKTVTSFLFSKTRFSVKYIVYLSLMILLARIQPLMNCNRENQSFFLASKQMANTSQTINTFFSWSLNQLAGWAFINFPIKWFFFRTINLTHFFYLTHST